MLRTRQQGKEMESSKGVISGQVVSEGFSNERPE
jgi:hypothetical protein